MFRAGQIRTRTLCLTSKRRAWTELDLPRCRCTGLRYRITSISSDLSPTIYVVDGGDHISPKGTTCRDKFGVLYEVEERSPTRRPNGCLRPNPPQKRRILEQPPQKKEYCSTSAMPIYFSNADGQRVWMEATGKPWPSEEEFERYFQKARPVDYGPREPLGKDVRRKMKI